jgi:hypothetical protein
LANVGTELVPHICTVHSRGFYTEEQARIVHFAIVRPVNGILRLQSRGFHKLDT